MISAHHPKESWLAVLAWMSAAEGVAAVALLGSVSSSPESAVFHGYSIGRLIMLGTAALEVLVAVGLGITIARPSPVRRQILRRLDRLVSGNETPVAALSLLAVVALGALSAALLPDAGAGTLDRIRPLAVLVVLLCVQTLWLVWYWAGGRPHWSLLAAWRPGWRVTRIVLVVFAAIAAAMLLTHIGLRPDVWGWYGPGTPILAVQVVLVGAVAAGMTCFSETVRAQASARWGSRTGDTVSALFIVITIWIVASAVWVREPLHDWSHFMLRPRQPNFELYPSSDAATYDESAQVVLTGASRHAGLLVHPLYVFFLALIHSLAGPGYWDVITWQVPALAVIPAIGYVIASRLGGRFAGLLTAGLMIVRERNAFALTNVIQVSHSKLMMSDVPTLVLMLMLVLVLIIWLARRTVSIPLGLLAGGVLGLLSLNRSQGLLLIPFALGAAALARQPRRVLSSAAAFLAGAALVLMPWIWRNYTVSGKLVIENTAYYAKFLARYQGTERASDMLLPDGADDNFDRMQSGAVDFVLSNPGGVAMLLGAHTMRNEVASLAYLPLGPQLHDLRSYLDRWPLWSHPRQPVPALAWLWMLVTIVVIAIGMAAAYIRLRWAAFLPILIHVGYSLSASLPRVSGWRFILPADWVTLVYYCIGLTQLVGLALAVVSGRGSFVSGAMWRTSAPARPVRAAGSTRAVAVTALGLGLIGAALPGGELLIPNRYPTLDAEEKVNRFASEQALAALVPQTSKEDLSVFLQSEPGAIALYGRALYPVYYGRGQIHGDHTEFALDASKYNRLEFMLTGSDRSQVYLPLLVAPRPFRHAQDVLVIGCAERTHVRALLLLPRRIEQSLAALPWSGLACPDVP